MLHLPPDKNRLHDEQSAQSVKEHTAENEIDNRNVYDILDQICKDTDLYPYDPFQVIRPKSKAQLVLQMSMYDGEMKAWKWEKYVAQHVKYHIILGNFMEYGYQGLDSGLIPNEQHQVSQVVHSGCSSKGTPRQI